MGEWQPPPKGLRPVCLLCLPGLLLPEPLNLQATLNPARCPDSSTSLCLQISVQSKLCFLSSSHVQIWELDHKDDWSPKNWCLWTVVLEKTLESPLDCKEIKSVNPNGNQSWILIGRTDAEAGTPILGSPDAKSQLSGKDPSAVKDWGQENRDTEDEMVGWHH